MLARWIPAGAAVLEVGPGAGRWSEFLVERASRLVLVDVSEAAALLDAAALHAVTSILAVGLRLSSSPSGCRNPFRQRSRASLHPGARRVQVARAQTQEKRHGSARYSQRRRDLGIRAARTS